MRTASLILTSAMIGASGCVADGPQPPERPQPRQIAAPTGIPVDRVVLSVESFSEDSDDNGYYDTFGLTVYLFPDQNVHPLPMHVRGTMVFELTDADRKPIATWELPPDEFDKLRAASPTGLAGYIGSLCINDVGSDKVSTSKGSLSCRFSPVDAGPEVVSRGSATVRVGPTGQRRTR